MKRIAELQPLSHDHHHALILANRCKKAADSDNTANAIKLWIAVDQEFHSNLLPHFEIEEQTLSVPLKRLGETTLLGRMLEEHRHLKACIADTHKPEKELLRQFGDLLIAHVRFEERELFSQIQHRLTVEEKASLATSHT